MRSPLRSLSIGAFLALAATLPGQSSEPTVRAVAFNHSLRTISPRWPDGRYYEKYAFRGSAGDLVNVALAPARNSTDTCEHLLLYVDRGDGPETLRPDADGLEVEFEVEHDAEYTFYVVSRQPGQTGDYRFGLAVQTAGEPRPVYYSMILEGNLAANRKKFYPLDADTKGHPIRVRVDASGFEPVLETFRHENGSRVMVTDGDRRGPGFASGIISTLQVGKWEVAVSNLSSQSGTYRLVIEYPNVLRRLE